MVRSAPRPRRAAIAMASAAFALGLAARPETASGQNTFNPYLPYNSQYYSYVVPSMPNNLALPGAARASSEYNAEARGVNNSRFNSFDRWSDEYDADVGGRRSGSSRGTSNDARRPDSSRDRDRAYVPNREADRKFQAQEDRRTRDFYDQEDERDRIASQRDIYYAAASRTTDPARRAAYLRVVAKLADPKTAGATLKEIDEALAERKPGTTAENRNAAPAAKGARPPASLAAPGTAAGAAPARSTVTPSAGTAPRASTSAPAPAPAASAATPARRTSPEAAVPDRRPPMDSEVRDRAPAARAPSPPPGLAPLVAPDPIPDDAPPPPR